jgi:hypothetical protein
MLDAWCLMLDELQSAVFGGQCPPYKVLPLYRNGNKKFTSIILFRLVFLVDSAI